MLVDRILRFVADESADDFESLAREAFAFQLDAIPAYRRYCSERGVSPAEISSWRDVPAVPTLAFKSLELAVGEPEETFRSSGTTSSTRSVHRHAFPRLYRATIDASFPRYCLPPERQRGQRDAPMLSLIPSRQLAPDSSLSFMVDHALDRFGADDSLYAVSRRGVDMRSLRSWLGARQRDGRPAVLLATALALLQALDGLERLGLRFRLPPGSLLFETGGYKGREISSSPAEIERRVEAALAVPAGRIVREYGMTELTSQLYTDTLAGQPNDLYRPPHWCRVRILDPESLAPAEPGSIGMIAVFDLANLSSAVHLLTEDLGRLEDGGLRLAGRARGAELRGCSLTAEELAG